MQGGAERFLSGAELMGGGEERFGDDAEGLRLGAQR